MRSLGDRAPYLAEMITTDFSQRAFALAESVG